MAWIESHQELARHPKTRRLSRLLNVSLPTAIGHLHLLWWWALDYAQDGCLAKYEPEDIAEACLWNGDPQVLVQALTEAGFIDRTPDGLVIHDWDDYAGRLIEKRKANSARARRWRTQRSDKRATNAFVTRDECATNVATVPNQTVQNSTVQKSPEGEYEGKPIGGSTPETPDRESVDNSIKPARVVELWNAICGDVLPRVMQLTDGRRRKVASRLAASRDRDESWWRAYFQRIRASPFLRGDGPRGWRANFDWAVRSEEVVASVFEGKYDNGSRMNQASNEIADSWEVVKRGKARPRDPQG